MMPSKKPSNPKNELIDKRRKELLKMGYMPGIVDKAMEWAASSAEGIARYGLPKGDIDQLTVEILPQFLNDAEKYMRAFDHERGETESKS